MFYNEKLLVKYPAKNILQDAILRTDIYDNEAYSPIGGEVRELYLKYKDVPGWESIDPYNYPASCNGRKDVEPRKLLLKIDNDANVNGDLGIDDLKELNEKAIKYILDYNRDILYGYLYIDEQGARKLKSSAESRLESYITFKDNSDSDVRKSASDLIEESIYTDMQDVEIRGLINKLCYYVKLINQCSIAKEINVMQVIFLHYLHGNNQRLICSHNIEQIDKNGRVSSRYEDSFNSNKKWVEFWSWFTKPKDEWDQWNKIVYRFQDIVKKLGIDIVNDDYRRYNVDFADRVITTYLASNEELTDTFGFTADPNVIKLLTPEQLYITKSKLSGFEQDWLENKAEYRFLNAYRLRVELESVREEEEELFPDLRLKRDDDIADRTIFGNDETDDYHTFMDFLVELARKEYNSPSFSFDFVDVDSYGMLINNSNKAKPEPFKIRRVMLENWFKFRSNVPDYICITVSGLAIASVAADLTKFRYCKLINILDAYKKGSGTSDEFPQMRVLGSI